MIIDNLYPTSTTQVVGETSNQYTEEYSNTVSSIYSSEGSVSQDAYWLGWISPENLPVVFQHNHVVENDETITFVNDIVKKNMPIGYIYTSGSNYCEIYMKNELPNVTPANTIRFINNLHPEYSALTNGLATSISTGFFIYWNASVEGVMASTTAIDSRTNGLVDTIRWLNGEITLTLTFTYSGITYTIDVNLVDLEDSDDYYIEIPTNEDDSVIVTFSLTGINYNSYNRYKNGTSYGTIYTRPSAQVEYDDGENTGSYNFILNGYGSTWTIGFAAYYNNVGYVQYRDDYASPKTYEVTTGCSGTFLKADITALSNNGTLINNNIMAYHRKVSGNNRTYFIALLKPSDIVKIVSLNYRVYDDPNNDNPNPTISSYVENITWATDVSENNEFLARLKTGNITDSKFRGELRTWQYTNLQYNDFDPDDIPEYDPSGVGDDEGSNTGSDILRPSSLGVGGTNGFITQYSLTAAQMAEIGRLLWLTFTDADYYKNFLFTLTTTGTINLSNLLDYFVSLRVYPFPLINVPSHASAGTEMYIGSGIVPLSFSTTLHTINNYADYIDAGSCTIPRFYSDFRDLAHCQISLYLPYCGTVQLNPADVVGGTLSAMYAVDFATGGVTAYVDLTTFDGRQYPIAALSGSIGADIPLTASNAAQIAARIAGDALNFAGTIGEAVSADIGKSAQAIGSAAMGDYIGAAVGVGNVYAGRIGGAAEIAQRGLQIATQEGVKMPMLAGGRGFGAFGAPQTAYVQIRRGLYAEGQTIKAGYKAAYAQAYDQPVQVSSCSGFTVFNNVDTSGLDCDDEERSMIHRLMQSGIII